MGDILQSDFIFILYFGVIASNKNKNFIPKKKYTKMSIGNMEKKKFYFTVFEMNVGKMKSGNTIL